MASYILDIAVIWAEAGNGEHYLETGNTFTMNWKGFVDLAIKYIPIIYFYYIAFTKPLSEDNSDYKYYKVFLLFAFFVFYLSVLFYGHGSDALQDRFYKTSMFPLAFAISLYFKNNLHTKRCNTFIYLMFFGFVWNFLLMFFKSV